MNGGNEDDCKPTVKLNIIQSIPVLLDLIFKNKIPNYELSQNWSKNGRFQTMAHAPFQTHRFHYDHYVYKWSFGKPFGLLFGDGCYWKEARKLTMKLFHQLDFYKQENVENFINFELKDLEEEMLQAVLDGGGKVTMTMHHKFQVSALNVVFQVMLGKRFNRGDPVAKKMMNLINVANREFNLGTNVLEIFPWLLRVPFLKPMEEFSSLNDFMYAYLKRELLEPKRKAKTYAENPVDFVEYFLLEIDRRAHETPRHLTDENLLTTLRDLIFAGSDTTNTALEHGILHMSFNLLIQRKVQDEIDRIIETSQPTYDDRLNMPYSQAVVQEILGMSTPGPIIARCPFSDNEINGEHIPKESFVAFNLYAIHRDPEVWKNPEEFQPERFLNENNELVNLEKVMPFGWGKRLCVGETVARISLFLFFVMLMQTFLFEISKNHPAPSMKNQVGLSRGPLPYYVNLRCRKREL